MNSRGVTTTNWKGYFLFMIVVFIFPLMLDNSFFITKATFAGIFAIVAIGLGLLMGFAGQISLGQAAFYGVGAYSTAVLTTQYGFSPWLSLLFSLVIPAVIALVIGLTMSRLQGYYLAMATLAFGIVVHTLLVEMKTVTHGASGLYGIPQLNLFGLQIVQGLPYYYFVWSIVLLVIAISLNIIHSRVGRALRSIHDSEVAASAMGVDTSRYKMQVFVISAIFAGLAGWLFAHMSYSISPSSFHLDTSIFFLTMVVLGGSVSIWGAVFGAILLSGIGLLVSVLGEHVTFLTSDFEQVLYGLILVLIVIFLPEGVFPTLVKKISPVLSRSLNRKHNQQVKAS